MHISRLSTHCCQIIKHFCDVDLSTTVLFISFICTILSPSALLHGYHSIDLNTNSAILALFELEEGGISRKLYDIHQNQNTLGTT